MMDTTEQLTPLAIPIAATDRKQAYQFAAQQPTQERSEQVYRNTLAVLVMHHCLQLLGIDSDVEVSQSWNPLDRLLSNIADLYVPRLQGFWSVVQCIKAARNVRSRKKYGQIGLATLSSKSMLPIKRGIF
ncbi:DUF1822 family protein [bacterium]|nr:DUF1822 family protein [bacterium]